MITLEHHLDIHDLHRQGHSIREIARRTGTARNTVRKVPRGEHELTRKPAERTTKIDPFKDYLAERFNETGLSAVRLLEEIKPLGYGGSIATLRRFLATLKGEGERRAKLTVRFETPPGRQAQADWADCGRHPDEGGVHRPVYAFTMVLGYSRNLFACFTRSMKLPELLAAHREAFAYFGGWPEEVLYDNMRQVREPGGRFNQKLLDFAAHYGFTPKTHRPYRPRTKGKVERSISYLKDNFLKARSFAGLDDLNAKCRAWLDGVANARTHGTTGRVPSELLAAEGLTPHGSVPPYSETLPVKRQVSVESMVHFGGSRYSVPPEFSGQSVLVQSEGGLIVVRCDGAVIAEHRQAAKPGQCVVEPDHLAELWKLTAERVKPPEEAKWQLGDANAEVARMPLRLFEEVAG